MKYIVCAPVCGLGNRLYALYSSFRIASSYNVPLKIWWKPNSRCGCEYHDLFETPLEVFDEKIVQTCNYLYNPNIKAKIQDNVLIKNNHTFCDQETKYDIIIFGACQPILFGGETFNDSAKKFSTVHNNQLLQPTKEILAEVNKYNLATVIGIHVGRNHIVTRALKGEIKDLERYIPLEMYYDEIDKLDEKTKIFISCEDKEDEQAFIQKYGNRIIYRPGIKSRLSKEGMIEAFINILLLSKCIYIIDGHSSFSKMASYLGNNSIIQLKNTKGILPPTNRYKNDSNSGN